MTLWFGVKISCRNYIPYVMMPLANVATLILDVATLSPDVAFGVMF